MSGTLVLSLLLSILLLGLIEKQGVRGVPVETA
jgi:hypothetical protein